MRGVILIVSDALRADVTDKLLGLGLIPNIAKLARNGAVMRKAYSTTNTTDPSVTTILSGLHPLSHGVIFHGDTSARLMSRGIATQSLQQMLRPEYRTIAVDLQIPGTWHKRGFDVYVGEWAAKSPTLLARAKLREISEKYGGRYLREDRLPGFVAKVAGKARVPGAMGALSNGPLLRRTTGAALEQISDAAKAKRKFFTFIHYWATHAPYYATKEELGEIERHSGAFESRERLSRQSVEVAINSFWDQNYRHYLRVWFSLMNHRTLWDVIASNYASLIAVDRQIGRLVSRLEREGELDDTMFILTGDHGESLGEHEIFFSHHGLYQPTVRVPLIISNIKVDRPILESNVSHMDIVPTVLSATGMRRAPAVDGKDLLSDSTTPAVLAERPLVTMETLVENKVAAVLEGQKQIQAVGPKGSYCVLCHKIHGGGELELYDLESDPGEMTNEAGNSSPDKRLNAAVQRAAFLLRSREAILKVPSAK